MTDMFLKFKDRAAMTAALTLMGVSDTEDNPDILVDEIGIITKTSGNADNPVFTKQTGYHANLRILDDSISTDVLKDYLVEPVTPVRIWG